MSARLVGAGYAPVLQLYAVNTTYHKCEPEQQCADKAGITNAPLRLMLPPLNFEIEA